MRAQVLTKCGTLELKQIPVSECKANEVLIKIKKACICNGSDPSLYFGHHSDPFPFVFGHEACGEIINMGSRVKGFSRGDKVAWWCTMGAFAEYVCVAPEEVAMIKLTNTVPDGEGAIFELVGAASRAIEAAQIKQGSKVLIIGLGPSGLIMSQLAKSLGAEIVAGWDIYEMRREKGEKLGVDAAIDNSIKEIAEKTLEEMGQADIVIDAFGDDILPENNTLDNAIKVMKENGKIVTYGHPVNRRTIDVYEFQRKSIELAGPINDLKKIRLSMEKALELYKKGRLDIHSIISGSIPLEDVTQGLKMVMNHKDKYLKILVDI